MPASPSDNVPSIPGAADWRAGARSTPVAPATPPTFVSPVISPPGDGPTQFELAGWWVRAAAHLLDQLLRAVLAVAIVAAGFLLIADHPYAVSDAADATAADNNLLWFALAMVAVYYASALAYAPLFLSRWHGATPGKRLVGIRVVRENGTGLNFGHAFLREVIVKGLVVGIVASMLLALPLLLNYLWPLWDRECRAGHDVLVRTRVVRR